MQSETSNDAMIATSVATALHDPECDAETANHTMSAQSTPPRPREQAEPMEEGAEDSESSDEESDSSSDDSGDFVTSNTGRNRSKTKDGRLRKYGGQEAGLIKKYNRKHGERRMVGKSNNAKHGSSYLRLTTADEDQKAQTPASILGEITARYGGTLGYDGPLFDPCPAVMSKKKGKDKRVDPKQNGCAEDFEWGRVNYVNPPYGQIKLWFPKAIQEQAKGKTSIFLIPFRPFTRYFVECLPNISWLEVIYYGVGFRGYAAKIPHPMCMVCFLGKGVKNVKGLHMTQATNKKHHGFTGELTQEVPFREHTFVQRVPKPHAFDTATEICREHGIANDDIFIMINSSNMTQQGYLDEDRMAKARKSWKHAYALLVPFYNYSVAFQNAMRECSILAYSSPILSNYAGEGKCRFCSVLFVFCPKTDNRFKKFIADPKLHEFNMCFNYNGYLPSKEDLQIAKMKKIQAQKNLKVHKAGEKTVKGPVKDKRKSKKKSKKPKSAKKKPKSAKKAKVSSAKKTKKTENAHPKWKPSSTMPATRPKTNQGRINATRKYCRQFFEARGKFPSVNTIRAGTFGVKRELAEEIIADLTKEMRGRKRKATGGSNPAAKRAKISG